MFGFIKNMFIVLLASIFNTSNHTKCISLNNRQCMIQSTLINSHPNEYTERLHYYPFAVNLGRCMGSCNPLNDLFNRIYVANDLNLNVFNMITGINELKTLTKHISCKCKL